MAGLQIQWMSVYLGETGSGTGLGPHHLSPGLAHLTLPEAPKMTSAVITYLDDILIASETEEEHDKDLRALIDYLHVKGHKLSEAFTLDRKSHKENEISCTTALQQSGKHQNPKQSKNYGHSWAYATGIGWKTTLKIPNH